MFDQKIMVLVHKSIFSTYMTMFSPLNGLHFDFPYSKVGSTLKFVRAGHWVLVSCHHCCKSILLMKLLLLIVYNVCLLQCSLVQSTLLVYMIGWCCSCSSFLLWSCHLYGILDLQDEVHSIMGLVDKVTSKNASQGGRQGSLVGFGNIVWGCLRLPSPYPRRNSFPPKVVVEGLTATNSD